MIDTEEKLAQWLPELQTAPWIALDTEADSLHAYPERLCLLQISTSSRDDLIDPLARFDLSALWPVLKNHELVLHGADYDLRLLRRGFRFIPAKVFDTMIAARLLGYPAFSLGDLVSLKLGVRLEKGPQKMDWGRRPLTTRMEHYARNDTRYLQPLAELLRAELKAKGRLAWMQESCARLIADTSRDKLVDPETVWRLRGSDRLTPKALMILRELWHWREVEARKANRPPYFIFSHEHLIALAARAAHGPGSIEHHVSDRLSLRRRASLIATLRRALKTPASHYPALRQHKGRRMSRSEQHRVIELRDQRDRRATQLGIDPSLIASRGTLVALAQNGSSMTDDLMTWQRELLVED